MKIENIEMKRKLFLIEMMNACVFAHIDRCTLAIQCDRFALIHL